LPGLRPGVSRQVPLAGLSVFPDPRYREAVRPLFAAGEVEAVEWTLDIWSSQRLSAEALSWLEDFGAANRLIGHGVDYPVLDAGAEVARTAWLGKLRRDVARRNYQGVSVHFGFSTGWRIRRGAPLAVPYCPQALATGKRALERLAEAAGCPVGIENLGFAFSQRDVEEQGRFIDALLAGVDGYLLLDLHNLYCQSRNFGIPLLDLVKTYPLKRVREIHVAGGSWSKYGTRSRIRRDTHDGRVPSEILAVLPKVVALCPRLRFVMLERLPSAFGGAEDAAGFREDFRRMASALRRGAEKRRA
jgi:uncharacterized protein (UPF0276 family)